MHRRSFLLAAACTPACLAQAGEAARPRHRIGAASLYEALAARFPRRFAIGGVMELELTARRLHLVPARNRLGAGLGARLGGPAWDEHEGGEVDLLFALRYESSDRTLRARDPEIHALLWPGLPQDAARTLQPFLASAARQWGEFTLHRFTAQELALPDTMGFEPEEIRVEEDGVVVYFGPKR